VKLWVQLSALWSALSYVCPAAEYSLNNVLIGFFKRSTTVPLSHADEAMDGLSAAASVIAVIQISEEVVSRSSRYYKAVKHTKADIEDLFRELSGLKTVVERVQQLLEGPKATRLRTSQPLYDGLKDCNLKLQELLKKLKEKLNPGGGCKVDSDSAL
jgi:hypothetical protein